MKVNNITRLLVACLWCCCTLLIAENPYDEKPIVDNPLLIGEWPYYILALQLIALLHIYIIHLIVKPK